jgi:hypothetical protein
MPYQYGMQNSPSGGNGLGGLPKKQTTPKQVTYTRVLGVQALVFTPTIGTIAPPANAKYMRVAAIGPGGSVSGSTAFGGGGGGCAASKIVPASPISYSIINADVLDGDGAVAVFPGYRLLGGRGTSGDTGGGAAPGGIASGGDYNYRGGTGDVTSGGGAAGPNGNGQNAGTTGAPALGASGWGVGGGSAGTNTGGAGPNASIGNQLFIGASVWGRGTSNQIGGELGGGAKGNATSVFYGGVGGIVVEWFYD